jgi:hypothetical protein
MSQISEKEKQEEQTRADAFETFEKSLKTEKPSKRDARKLFVEIEREQEELSKKLSSKFTPEERLKVFGICKEY